MKRIKIKKFIRSLRWDQRVKLFWMFHSSFDEEHRPVKLECIGRPRDIADFCKKVGIWDDGRVFLIKTNGIPGIIEFWVTRTKN